MAAIVHDLIDQVLQRVRDPQGVVSTRDFTRLMLGYAQQIVNAKTAFIVDESPLVTEPLRCFYPLVSLVPHSQMVTFVRDEYGKDLLAVTWKSFWFMKRGWPRTIAERHEVWSTIGRDMLVVWPSRRVSETLTVVSARMTRLFANEGEAMEVRDDVMPAVVDLATVLVLLKMRKGDLATESMDSLTARMAALSS